MSMSADALIVLEQSRSQSSVDQQLSASIKDDIWMVVVVVLKGLMIILKWINKCIHF